MKIELPDLLRELASCKGDIEILAAKIGTSDAILGRRLAGKR